MDGLHELGAAPLTVGEPGSTSTSSDQMVVPVIGSVEEFDRLVAEIERAGEDWGVRPMSKEGRYVKALLASTRWMGRLSEAARADERRFLKQNRDTAEVELARAKEITKAANIALSQARNAQIALQVEHENVTSRMIQQTLPMFAEKLQALLVLKEKGLNSRAQWARYAWVVVGTLGLFGGGYRVRQMQEVSGGEAITRCLAHPLAAQGHIYCDVANLTPAR